MDEKIKAEVKTEDAKAVAKVAPRAPKIKYRAHLLCLLLAAVVVMVTPHLLHSDVLTGFAAVTPNVLQETIDRLLRL